VFFSGTPQRSSLSSAKKTLGKKTLGKRSSLPSSLPFFDTRQRASLPSIFFALGKENFKSHFEAVK
jgi:hypothetical protein